MRHPLLFFIQGDDVLHPAYFLSEIPFVERCIEDPFINGLKLGEGELFRQEFKANRLVFHLLAQGQQCLL